MRLAIILAAAAFLAGCVTTTPETPAERQRRQLCQAQIQTALKNQRSDEIVMECDRGRCEGKVLSVYESLNRTPSGRIRYHTYERQMVDACIKQAG